MAGDPKIAAIANGISAYGADLPTRPITGRWVIADEVRPLIEACLVSEDRALAQVAYDLKRADLYGVTSEILDRDASLEYWDTIRADWLPPTETRILSGQPG